MRSIQFGILVIFLGLLMPGPLDAQIRQRSRPNRTLKLLPQRRDAKLPGKANTPRARRIRRNQQQSSRFQLERMLNESRRRFLKPSDASSNPVQRLLVRRNRLKSRSILAERTAERIGRKDYIRSEEGRWRGGLAGTVDPQSAVMSVRRMKSNNAQYTSVLTQRISKKADEYFELGAVYFRNGNYLRSREYFKLVHQLEHDRPRAYVADVLASYEQKDLNTTLTSLIYAIESAKSLDSLKLDRRRFYPSDLRFQQVVDSVVILAKSANSNRETSLLLAFYAWLNGDLNTGITAADDLIRILEKDEDSAHRADKLLTLVKRFRSFLIEARDAPAASAAGG